MFKCTLVDDPPIDYGEEIPLPELCHIFEHYINPSIIFVSSGIMFISNGGVKTNLR